MTGELEFASASLAQEPGASLVAAMRAEIEAMYEGLDLDGEDMPRAGAAELGPPHGAFLVGWRDGVAVCCGGLKRLDDTACEIKRMYVAPPARGAGVARRLLGALEDAARGLGYEIVRLDTGHRQLDALHLYASAGYEEIENFNGNPMATYFAEKSLR